MGMRSRVDDPRPFLQEKPHKSKALETKGTAKTSRHKTKTKPSNPQQPTHTHNQSINVVFICAKNSFPLNVSKLPSTFPSARWCCSCFWHWGFRVVAVAGMVPLAAVVVLVGFGFAWTLSPSGGT